MVKNFTNKTNLKKSSIVTYNEQKYIITKLNINSLLKKLDENRISKKTIHSIDNIFKKYEFFFENIKMKNEPKDKIKHRSLYPLIFYKRKTIEEYINSLNSDAYSTKIKKRNILINLLFQMRTGIIKKKKYAKNYEKVDILP